MKMKKCAFTICTGSYRGFAETLRESFTRFNPEYEFYVFFTDLVSLDGDNTLLCDKAFNEYDNGIDLDSLKFKYDIVEYATCAKPFCFSYLFSCGYEQVLYFDPDIMFFSKFEELDDSISSVLLTPHILMIPWQENDIKYEEAFLRFGMYNCGFVGFNHTQESLLFIDWWKKRLIDRSFASVDAAYYTDQKWMDFVTSFFAVSHVNIIRNIGCNFASWNFSEREIQTIDCKYYVTGLHSSNDRRVPLVFMHYSGYKFRELLENSELFIPSELEKYKTVYPLVQDYRNALMAADTLSYMNIQYKYGTYDNGDSISLFQRRIFNGLVSKGAKFSRPFDCGNDSFYMLLKKNHFDLRNNGGYKPGISTNKEGQSGKNKKKGRRLAPLFRLLFRMLGERRYVTFLLALRPYLNYDNNDFLIK